MVNNAALYDNLNYIETQIVDILGNNCFKSMSKVQKKTFLVELHTKLYYFFKYNYGANYYIETFELPDLYLIYFSPIIHFGIIPKIKNIDLDFMIKLTDITYLDINKRKLVYFSRQNFVDIGKNKV